MTANWPCLWKDDRRLEWTKVKPSGKFLSSRVARNSSKCACINKLTFCNPCN